MGGPTVETPPSERASEARLDSWKEIAAYLKRDVTTVQRWERREGMPVHRHLHDKQGSVYAYKSELDAWWNSRRGKLPESSDAGAEALSESLPPEPAATDGPASAENGLE